MSASIRGLGITSLFIGFLLLETKDGGATEEEIKLLGVTSHTLWFLISFLAILTRYGSIYHGFNIQRGVRDVKSQGLIVAQPMRPDARWSLEQVPRLDTRRDVCRFLGFWAIFDGQGLDAPTPWQTWQNAERRWDVTEEIISTFQLHQQWENRRCHKERRRGYGCGFLFKYDISDVRIYGHNTWIVENDHFVYLNFLENLLYIQLRISWLSFQCFDPVVGGTGSPTLY